MLPLITNKYKIKDFMTVQTRNKSEFDQIEI